MASTRRSFLAQTAAISGGWALLGADWQDKLKATPPNTLGPFYKKGAPKVDSLRSKDEEGIVLVMSGRVMGRDGKPLPEATLEVWQADVDGHYDQEEFHLRAEIHLNKKGRYQFETVMPGHYPLNRGGAMRPQHIHYRIRAPKHKELVTQVYFETDPFFDGAPTKNLKRDRLVRHRSLIVPVQLKREKKVYSTKARFDVVLAKS